MDAFHVDRRLLLRSGDDRTEHRRIVDELALKHGSDLVALGHDVVGDESFGCSGRERLLKRGQIFEADDPRLVRQYMQTGVNRLADVLDLAAITAGEYYKVPRAVGEHSLQKIRRGVNVQFPACRILRARIEARDAAHVLRE